MSSVNYPNRKVDPTARAFNDFYNLQDFPPADANTYDIVNSYFVKIFSDTQIARNFSYNLFQISANSGISVQDLFDKVKGQDKIAVTKIFSYYLNNIRSNSTLIGINSTLTPNVNVARNVLV